MRAAWRGRRIGAALAAAALVVGLAGTGLVGVGLADPGPGLADERVRLDGLTPAQEALAAWAVDLYDRAGLALPEVTFVAHPTTEPCRGRDGITIADGESAEIGICTTEAGGAEEILFLHELAHAWDRHALEGERRRAFLGLRHLDVWRSDALAWEDVGAEQAAEVLVWGLIDRPVWIVRIGEISCDELRAGYVALTGAAPLHGYTDLCDR